MSRSKYCFFEKFWWGELNGWKRVTCHRIKNRGGDVLFVIFPKKSLCPRTLRSLQRTEQLKKLGTWLSYLDYFKPTSGVFIRRRPTGQTAMQSGTAGSNFSQSMVIGNTHGYKGLLKVQLSLVLWQGLFLPLLWHLFPEVEADPS